MPYSELMVRPMREELTRLGIEELQTPREVDAFLENGDGETTIVVVNSVCGCAAGSMRPGLAMALERGARPERMATVFAGQDVEATERAREHFTGYPPSSPAVALFKDGDIAHMMPRERIQGRRPEAIADDLADVFAEYCGS